MLLISKMIFKKVLFDCVSATGENGSSQHLQEQQRRHPAALRTYRHCAPAQLQPTASCQGEREFSALLLSPLDP